MNQLVDISHIVEFGCFQIKQLSMCSHSVMQTATKTSRFLSHSSKPGSLLNCSTSVQLSSISQDGFQLSARQEGVYRPHSPLPQFRHPQDQDLTILILSIDLHYFSTTSLISTLPASKCPYFYLLDLIFVKINHMN